jgi:tetratricopeptide (TPR) repeat protein
VGLRWLTIPVTLVAVLTSWMSHGIAAEPYAEVRSALRSWNLPSAETLLRSAKPQPAQRLEHQVLTARLDLLRSDYQAVIKRLMPVVSAHPRLYEARVVLGKALYATGRSKDALKILDVIANDYTNDEVSKAKDLMWLGVGLHLTDYPKNAVTVFEEAIATDSKLTEARVFMGDLFVSKANYRDSDQLYQEVLKQDPSHVGARLGAAKIDIESDRNFPEARKKALAILKTSPLCVPAHNMVARLELLGEQPSDAVKRLLGHSLKLAPNDPEALTLLGAAYLVLDDDGHYEKTKKRALALNSTFASFFSDVAEHAARVHRYKKALSLNQEALQLNPEHWPALANLGIGYSRLGDDANAKKKLEEAFYGDSFNVRTYNLLTFFYDKVINEFEWVDVKPMRLRVHRTEKEVLERYVPPLLKEAYGYLKKKYDFVPQTPLHIEIFPDKQLFSVRSTGLPRLGAHGICFGHVITSRSPSEGNYNWAEVLWHELSHVFHIQLSKSRVPRWFTEGLAVYESTEGRPQWRREMDPTLLQYHRDGKLRGVVDFNLSFTQAKSFRDILVAYYHAYLVAEFTVERFGSARMGDLLKEWGLKKTTEEVFRNVLGVSMATFDADFTTWLEKRLKPLTNNFEIDPQKYASELKKWSEAATKSGASTGTLVNAAMAYYGSRQMKKALELVEGALKSDAKNARALALRAKIGLGQKEFAKAKSDLEVLVGLGLNGPWIQEGLAFVAETLKDRAEAIKHLEKAITLNPRSGSPYYVLIRLLDEAKREKEAYVWRKRLTRIDQMNIKLVHELLRFGPSQGASSAELLAWGEMGNHIAPFSVKHHLAFAKVLIGLGKKRKARYELKTALLIEPKHAEASKLLKQL